MVGRLDLDPYQSRDYHRQVEARSISTLCASDQGAEYECLLPVEKFREYESPFLLGKTLEEAMRDKMEIWATD